MVVVSLSANTSWYLYNFRRSTIKELLEKGFDVICVSPYDEYSEKLVSELGCKWVNVKISNKGMNPIMDALTFINFLSIYFRLKPKYVFNFTLKNNIYGTWAARLIGARPINNISGLGTAFINEGWVKKLVMLLYRVSMPLAQKVFCQNTEDFNYLINNSLVPEKKLELIPGSGVNLKRFNPDIRVQVRSSTIKFLYVGRMLYDKGLAELLEAIKSINKNELKCELILCGFMDAQNKSAVGWDTLTDWIKIQGVEWIGASDDMPSVYASCDCVILPSYREGLPKTLIEAGAMGLPSIATDVPGCRDIIEDNYNGLLCEAKSVDSLTMAIKKIINSNQHQLDTMSKNARTNVERYYDEKIVIDRTLSELY